MLSDPRRGVGIGGQDGSYLTDLLLAKGYEVYGLVRQSTTQVPERLAYVADRIHLLRGDLIDQLSLKAAVAQARPHEIYNLAGTSLIQESWEHRR